MAHECIACKGCCVRKKCDASGIANDHLASACSAFKPGMRETRGMNVGGNVFVAGREKQVTFGAKKCEVLFVTDVCCEGRKRGEKVVKK